MFRHDGAEQTLPLSRLFQQIVVTPIVTHSFEQTYDSMLLLMTQPDTALSQVSTILIGPIFCLKQLFG